ELHDRHRRHRRQVVGIQNPQQGVGQFGEFVVELVMDAPGQQGERFDEALDMRIGAESWLKAQPRGGRRILPGEILGKLPDENQLTLVVRKKRVDHPAPSRIWTCPVVNSTIVSKATAGAGSTFSSASM